MDCSTPRSSEDIQKGRVRRDMKSLDEVVEDSEGQTE